MASLPAALEPLRDGAAEAALFLDYDGTLAPIVDDPAAAAPIPGVPELLAELGRRLAVVAVVSGRPVAYLAAQLGRPAGVHLAGLYGIEAIERDGAARVLPGMTQWQPVVAAAAQSLRRALPTGAEVEEKGLSVAVHWRTAPDVGPAATLVANDISAAAGLVAHPGRMSVELRPPVATDKGTVVRRLGAGHAAVACFGDDLGDLPAFAALDELGAAGAYVVKVAVTDAEAPPAVAAAADVLLYRPEGAVAALREIVSG